MPQPSPAYRVAADPSIRVVVDELACCALEVGSAVTLGLLVPEVAAPGQPRITALLVSGTVTRALAPAVLARWEAIDEPRVAIAIGACASSGGPYWDAPTIITGLDGIVPTGGLIAGCPPRPQAIVDGLRSLLGAP